MPTIKIDNKDYDLDSLSDKAKAQLQSLQFVDSELLAGHWAITVNGNWRMIFKFCK